LVVIDEFLNYRYTNQMNLFLETVLSVRKCSQWVVVWQNEAWLEPRSQADRLHSLDAR